MDNRTEDCEEEITDTVMPADDSASGSEDEVADIVKTEEVIQQAISVASLQPSTIQADDMDIQQFLRDGCGCKLNDGQNCSTLINAEQLQKNRFEANELSRGELDNSGEISSISRLDSTWQHHAHFLHGGQRVCKKNIYVFT